MTIGRSKPYIYGLTIIGYFCRTSSYGYDLMCTERVDKISEHPNLAYRSLWLN